MTDAECVAFLQWALPRLHLRWTGFSNLRGQVCKRLRRRLTALGLPDLTAYRARLEVVPEEWAILDRLCVVTISRFYRDRGVWDLLRDEVLPALAERASASPGRELRCWCIGCASGEEPYTLSITWSLALAHRYPGVRLRVLATDRDEQMLERARAACYPGPTLRDLPPGWLEQAFEPHDDGFHLRDRFRDAVELRVHDVRAALPDEAFHLMACRNLVFTYFEERLQTETLARLSHQLEDVLVIGAHERLPPGSPFEPWRAGLEVYREGAQ